MKMSSCCWESGGVPLSKYRFESLYYCECYKVNLSEIDRVCCEDNVAVVFGIL